MKAILAFHFLDELQEKCRIFQRTTLNHDRHVVVSCLLLSLFVCLIVCLFVYHSSFSEDSNNKSVQSTSVLRGHLKD